jgi:hypothetical protein
MAGRKAAPRKGRKTARPKPAAAPKPDVGAKPAVAAAKLPAPRQDLGLGDWSRHHTAAPQPRGTRKQPQRRTRNGR